MVFTKYFCCYTLNEKEYLMVNTLTSAIDVVDKETFALITAIREEKLSISELKENNNELFNALVTRGYIFASREAERALLEKMRCLNENMSFRKLNTTYTICPTMGCNLRCTYCFESTEQHVDCGVMTEGQLQAIFNHIIKCCNEFKKIYDSVENKEMLAHKQPNIVLFGGEPLLSINFAVIKKILEFAEQMNIPVKIITNGTTIDLYKELLHQYKHRIAIQITMDGDKATHDVRRIHANKGGTFDEICKGVDAILSIGIRVNLRINVDRDNVNNIGELQEVFKKYGWLDNPLFIAYASPVLCFSGDSKTTLTESEMLEKLIENGWYGFEDSFIKSIVGTATGFAVNFFEDNGGKIKPWKMTYCEATSGSNYCFAPDGSITTCLTYIGKGVHTIGHFDENGVVIDEDNYKMWIERNPFKMERCKDCKYILLCGGGCPVAALQQNNDIGCSVCNDIERTLEVYVSHIKERFIG